MKTLKAVALVLVIAVGALSGYVTYERIPSVSLESIPYGTYVLP